MLYCRLGWLIAGMIIGPHVLNLLSSSALDSTRFDVTESIFECTFGLMAGAELIWEQLKNSGPRILITTVTESLGTFVIVSLVFDSFLVCRCPAVFGFPACWDRGLDQPYSVHTHFKFHADWDVLLGRLCQYDFRRVAFRPDESHESGN